MGLFEFLKGKKPIKGIIGCLTLADWWLSAFSEEERLYIQKKFQPFGLPSDPLTSGSYTSQTSTRLLYGLAGWFSTKKDSPIAYKILEKVEELPRGEARILDIHFLYGYKITIHYKNRDKPGYLEKAIDACKQQIELAPKAADAFKTEAEWGGIATSQPQGVRATGNHSGETEELQRGDGVMFTGREAGLGRRLGEKDRTL